MRVDEGSDVVGVASSPDVGADVGGDVCMSVDVDMMPSVTAGRLVPVGDVGETDFMSDICDGRERVRGSVVRGAVDVDAAVAVADVGDTAAGNTTGAGLGIR